MAIICRVRRGARRALTVAERGLDAAGVAGRRAGRAVRHARASYRPAMRLATAACVLVTALALAAQGGGPGTAGPCGDPGPQARAAAPWYLESFAPDGTITRTRALPAGMVSSGITGLPASATPIHGATTANRFTVVFVGDGYTAEQAPEFAQQVDALWRTLLATQPFDAYAPYLAAYRVDIAAPGSGVSDDPARPAKTPSPLGMHYRCQGVERLLCADDATVGSYAALAPAQDLVVAVANSSTYGGLASGRGTASVAGGVPETAQILAHELGHSLGALGDEYADPKDLGGHGEGGAEEPPFPNVTTVDTPTRLLQDKAKWWRWLDTSAISTYEGGLHQDTGYYRPTADSLMRSLGQPFNYPSAEALVKSLYGRVKPIDASSPSENVATRQNLTVTTVLPATSLEVSWAVDGAAVPALAGRTSADTGALGLAPGTWHSVQASVRDTTVWVRDEAYRDDAMTQTVSWWVWGG
ncbi:M64 family metallopeptidase [Yinghuangia seranimata]|uniref:M64 family metallopeptidase n=1 Tax=Yinghuangia seranimata TaxID=408067 RepID=UPI00248C8F00|nr:M64 family metallopeptidase [Yinghuangia seranimata]MDI2127299.1 M64 family metallopeptidase [Yinghuangia seranimata]